MTGEDGEDATSKSCLKNVMAEEESSKDARRNFMADVDGGDAWPRKVVKMLRAMSGRKKNETRCSCFDSHCETLDDKAAATVMVLGVKWYWIGMD